MTKEQTVFDLAGMHVPTEVNNCHMCNRHKHS